MVGKMLILVGIVVVMLSMNWRLALLSFGVIPLMSLAMVLFSRRAKTAFRQTRTSVAAVVGDLAEGIAGMRVIQAFAQEEKAQERFDQVMLPTETRRSMQCRYRSSFCRPSSFLACWQRASCCGSAVNM